MTQEERIAEIAARMHEDSFYVAAVKKSDGNADKDIFIACVADRAYLLTLLSERDREIGALKSLLTEAVPYIDPEDELYSKAGKQRTRSIRNAILKALSTPVQPLSADKEMKNV